MSTVKVCSAPAPGTAGSQGGPVTGGVVLTPGQRRCAEPLVHGWSTGRIAAHLELQPHGVLTQLKNVRRLLGLGGAPRPVLVDALVRRGLVEPPACERPVPDFTAGERALLSALARHGLYADIAVAAGVPQARLRTEIEDLVAKAAATNSARLVALAHRWQLLVHDPPPDPHALEAEATP